MVDTAGVSPIIRDQGVARIAAITPVAAVQTVAAPAPGVAATQPASATALSGVAQSLSASPPVDSERIARIRKAIADGQFPILPATIADQMIAYRLQWANK